MSLLSLPFLRTSSTYLAFSTLSFGQQRYWRAFDKLRAGLSKCVEPLRDEYSVDGLRAQHEEAVRYSRCLLNVVRCHMRCFISVGVRAKQNSDERDATHQSFHFFVSVQGRLHAERTAEQQQGTLISDATDAAVFPPSLDSFNGASLQGLSSGRAGVVAAARVADLAYPQNELQPWLRIPQPSSNYTLDSILTGAAATASPSASPSRNVSSSALATPTKARAVDGSRLRVPANDETGSDTTLGQSSTANESPTRALFSKSALENFNLVDNHYSAPSENTEAARAGDAGFVLKDADVFRGRSLHLPFHGESDVRNHFLRFFVFLFQVRCYSLVSCNTLI